jgi:hypothetical protein
MGTYFPGCYDCREKAPYYMLLDAIWIQAWPDYKLVERRRDTVARATGSRPCLELCFPCVERRLGRTLTQDDFADAPVNWLLRPNITIPQ